jgi:two-component system KDP operon response regulator KdpE
MRKKKARILIADNEMEILRLLRRSLTTHGFDVLVARRGEETLDLLQLHHPDLLLIELALPGISGLEVCKRLRAQSNLPPIIVLSEENKEQEKVQVLDLGADDYISKPFSIEEVLARIRVALRHASYASSLPEPIVRVGPLSMDVARRCVCVHGQEVKLTPIEYELLHLLIQHHGKVLTQAMLLAHVWRDGKGTKAHSLHVYVGRLRQKIEPDPLHPRLLTTIPGVGYCLNDQES